MAQLGEGRGRRREHVNCRGKAQKRLLCPGESWRGCRERKPKYRARTSLSLPHWFPIDGETPLHFHKGHTVGRGAGPPRSSTSLQGGQASDQSTALLVATYSQLGLRGARALIASFGVLLDSVRILEYSGSVSNLNLTCAFGFVLWLPPHGGATFNARFLNLQAEDSPNILRTLRLLRYKKLSSKPPQGHADRGGGRGGGGGGGI